MANFTKAALLLAVLLCSVQSPAAEMEFFFYKSPAPLNWETPGNLVRSTLDNSFKKAYLWRTDENRYQLETYPHSISHVDVKIQCDHEAPIYRGMTSTESDFAYLGHLIGQGASVDTLITPVAGHFYQNSDVLKWLPSLLQQNYVRSFKLKLNADQCGQAKNYLKLYVQYGLDKIYGGLRSDPQWGQGAGCSAFAVSFLKVLGLFIPELQSSWSRTLSVGHNLLSSQTRRTMINFLAMVLGADRDWQISGERKIRFSFFDPEKMYDWVEHTVTHQVHFQPGVSFQESSQTRLKTVVWDVSDQPAPQGWPFYLSPAKLTANVKFQQQNAGRFLTEAELLNPFDHECRAGLLSASSANCREAQAQ